MNLTVFSKYWWWHGRIKSRKLNPWFLSGRCDLHRSKDFFWFNFLFCFAFICFHIFWLKKINFVEDRKARNRNWEQKTKRAWTLIKDLATKNAAKNYFAPMLVIKSGAKSCAWVACKWLQTVFFWSCGKKLILLWFGYRNRWEGSIHCQNLVSLLWFNVQLLAPGCYIDMLKCLRRQMPWGTCCANRASKLELRFEICNLKVFVNIICQQFGPKNVSIVQSATWESKKIALFWKPKLETKKEKIVCLLWSYPLFFFFIVFLLWELSNQEGAPAWSHRLSFLQWAGNSLGEYQLKRGSCKLLPLWFDCTITLTRPLHTLFRSFSRAAFFQFLIGVQQFLIDNWSTLRVQL